MTNEEFKNWQSELKLSNSQAAKVCGVGINMIEFLRNGRNKVTKQVKASFTLYSMLSEKNKKKYLSDVDLP